MITLLLSLLSFPAFADPLPLEDSLIATSSFQFSRPTINRITVQTCNSKGKVRAVQVVAKQGGVNILSMDALYQAGGKQRLASNLNLESGKSSTWMPLGNQENPCLSQLELKIGPTRGRTTIEIMGRWE